MSTENIKRVHARRSESVLLLTPEIPRLKRIKEMSYNVRPLLLPLHFLPQGFHQQPEQLFPEHRCQTANDNNVL